MSEALFDLLQPHLPPALEDQPRSSSNDAVTAKYLARLPKLDLNALQTSEPQSLAQATHSNALAIQALSSRSAKTLISSSDHLSKLSTTLPSITKHAKTIHDDVDKLDKQAVSFSEKYARSSDTTNAVLDRRKRALLLARNADRVVDMLELPTLLSSAVHSAAASGGTAGSGTNSSAIGTTTTYNAALDLHGHIKRLSALHPDSSLVQQIGTDASGAMREMTASLIHALRTPNLKLAGGMRTIGWLRRVAPTLVSAAYANPSTDRGISAGTSEEEGALGAIFLVCRLSNLMNMLEALEPLKQLADLETEARDNRKAEASSHQTERYLKRFIELFREQSFGIVSMFRSIFPEEADHSNEADLGLDFGKMGLGNDIKPSAQRLKPEPLPSAISTFPLHLISNILIPTLRTYLPNISDRSARESLLTQVLYCAGSLGRLGGDFSLLLADIYANDETSDDDDDDDERIQEWVEVMQKHRIQAARLESLAATGSSGFASLRAGPKEGVAA